VNTPEKKPVEVVLVDDHRMFRSGVRAELGQAVSIVGEAPDVDAAIAVIRQAKPPVVLLDVHLPGGNGNGGIDVIHGCKGLETADGQPVRFLALSVSDAAEDVIAVIRAGARGYVTKTISATDLTRAIQRVAEISPPLGHYLGGLAYVARQNAEGGGINFLAGKTSIAGFPSYFLVAFLVKSSLGFLAATALALGGAAAFRLGRDAALWLLPAAVLFIASAGSSYNIGVRHLLPAYPFLALGAAAVLARLAAAGPRRRRRSASTPTSSRTSTRWPAAPKADGRF